MYPVHAPLVGNSLAVYHETQGQESEKILMLEKEISALRIQNSNLMERKQQPAGYDAQEKVSVLSELNDKLELDLDLALKELALNKRKADSAEAKLAKVQDRNTVLEAQLAKMTAETTKSEQQLATKRDWAEKRLHQEESTIIDLQRQCREMQAELVRQKQFYEEKLVAYDIDFKRQEGVMANMKEAHKQRLAKAEEALRVSAKRARAAGTTASEVFAKFDANGDGVLDEDEFAAAFDTFAPKTQHNPFPPPDSRENRFDYQYQNLQNKPAA
jgi:hypothetical protein